MSNQNREQKQTNQGNNIFRKISDMMGIILMWGMILAFVAMAIYLTVCSMEDSSYISRAKNVWVAAIFAIIFGVAFMLMLRFAGNQWKKAAEYDPVQGRLKLPDASRRSLDETLTYMTGRPGLLVWDILWGCAMFSMAMAFISDTAHYGAAARLVLVTGGCLIVGHIIFTIYYNNHSYRTRMINTTRRYLNITNEEVYCDALEKNLVEKMVYRSMRFVVSEDFIIGYTNRDTSFEPVAIPICTITSAEYRLEQRNVKPRGTQGILSCRLNNGNTVVFCTSQGPEVEKVPKVLNYCKIPYTYK